MCAVLMEIFNYLNGRVMINYPMSTRNAPSFSVQLDGDLPIDIATKEETEKPCPLPGCTCDQCIGKGKSKTGEEKSHERMKIGDIEVLLCPGRVKGFATSWRISNGITKPTTAWK